MGVGSVSGGVGAGVSEFLYYKSKIKIKKKFWGAWGRGVTWGGGGGDVGGGVFFTRNLNLKKKKIFFLGGGRGGEGVGRVDGWTVEQAQTNLPLQFLRSWGHNNAFRW